VLEQPSAATFQRDAAEQTATRLVDQILARAAADRASDIHVEPQDSTVRLRLRIDGMLKDIASLPTRLAPSITARIKILARMNISEQRLPQDGRFSAVIGSRRLDVRAATYPTVFGEKTALRLLDRTTLNVRLEEIGMSGSLLAAYRDLIQRPEGIVLVTGPTGSGKTSTLYGSVRELSERGLNILTLENPVEYELPGINQGQVNEIFGFTFAKGLRAILRHMGLEPYLLASAVIGVVAQRLVRRICDTCRVAEPILPEVARLFPPPAPAALARGKGCRVCGHTGYRGRVGLFELLSTTEEIRRLVIQRAPEDEIETASRRYGYETLRAVGLRRVVEGTATLEEVLRVTRARE
jgi:type IV pilus assembly protein PilB